MQQSNLALSLELQAARAAAGGQFDAAKAVEEQLRKSFQTRCGLEESVTEGEGAGGRPGAGAGCAAPLTSTPPAVSGLNVPRSRRLFRDLVSLQVPEEQVLNAALRGETGSPAAAGPSPPPR